jgi:hypothetical protein
MGEKKNSNSKNVTFIHHPENDTTPLVFDSAPISEYDNRAAKRISLVTGKHDIMDSRNFDFSRTKSTTPVYDKVRRDNSIRRVLRPHVSDVMKSKKANLEHAYNVKLSSNDSTRRLASTEMESRISSILARKDNFDGRPYHPLGVNRRRLSN